MRVPRGGVEAALNASRRVAERLSPLARDPEVRRGRDVRVKPIGLFAAHQREGMVALV
ncbi:MULTISPECIES: hypothetical protein [Deinococcus]|uniref:hypothetical protein n=1 Tax=Deinococcus TaxID=1298 RepID=UPI0012F7CDEC|nr:MULTISPECIES: hypothetical protein [Deinococcus]